MAATSIPIPAGSGISQAFQRAKAEPAYGAFLTLWVGFIVLPIVFGVDKFANVLTNWEAYLAPWLVDVLPFSSHTAMIIIGIVEIVAGIMIAIKPRYAAYVVALWLAGIIINLLTYSGFYDVALRDFGLLVAALALAQLARTYDTGKSRRGRAKS
ncbi:hypothetical protein [Crystallibacter degradans]|uniref:hypothetical protein n=1 Tax=Crystallibacter degradans TaxID=2726743 RepID=UPI00197CAC9E|nr:hypothetical protein [Arthrobacter sp. SF27]